MSLRLTKLGGEKRLDQIPGDGWSYSPATHTQNSHNSQNPGAEVGDAEAARESWAVQNWGAR